MSPPACGRTMTLVAVAVWKVWLLRVSEAFAASFPTAREFIEAEQRELDHQARLEEKRLQNMHKAFAENRKENRIWLYVCGVGPLVLLLVGTFLFEVAIYSDAVILSSGAVLLFCFTCLTALCLKRLRPQQPLKRKVLVKMQEKLLRIMISFLCFLSAPLCWPGLGSLS